MNIQIFPLEMQKVKKKREKIFKKKRHTKIFSEKSPICLRDIRTRLTRSLLSKT